MFLGFQSLDNKTVVRQFNPRDQFLTRIFCAYYMLIMVVICHICTLGSKDPDGLKQLKARTNSGTATYRGCG